MPNYRKARPAILWGDAFANTLLFGYPLDEAMTYALPREGSEEVQGSSGIEDSWDEGTDHYIEGRARWIPRETGNTPEGVSATGWEGATGWREFLIWAWRKNVLRFVPDRDFLAVYKECYLVAPRERPATEIDYTRHLLMTLRTVDGTALDGY